MANAVQYNTFEELKRSAELDTGLARKMGQIRQSAVMFDKVKSLFDSATDARGEPEKAYILFSRCIHVCNLLMGCSDFASFSQTSEAIRFRTLFTRSMDEFEHLEKHLKSIYAEYRVSKPASEPIEIPIIRQKPEVHMIDREDFGNFITPKQLIQYVEKMRKIVLILDYRLKKGSNISYTNPNFIRVLPLDSDLISPGLQFNHLRMYIDFRYRPILVDMQHFDLVVLMGDELESSNATPFKNGTKTKVLLDAITVNNVHNQLKRNPLLLDGGFKAWQNTYPMYVEQPHDQESFFEAMNVCDDFTSLVQVVKQNLNSELVYPELSPQVADRHPKPSHRKSPDFNKTFIESPSQPVGNFERNDKKFGSLHERLDRIWLNDTSRKDPSQTENAGRDIDRFIPSIDRSKKPSSGMNSTAFPVSIDSDPVPFNKGSCRSDVNAPQMFDRRPQIPTLGGARMDTSSPAPGSTLIANRIPVRPTVPDRNNRAIDQEQQQHLLNICHIYDKAMCLIEQNASRGQVPPGYTGLVNLTNTCFMNSALQALFNTPGIRNIFAQKKFASYLNPKNKAQSKGIISSCFASLIDSVWSSQFRYIRPDNFLNVFAREVNSQLANRHQHDSQEFLSLLVDALHEETNRVEVKKPFEQNYDGKNINVYADDYTKNLHLFASSPINDIFGLRSITQLTCMTCNTSSVTFCDNPLTFLELPLNNGPYCSLKECLKHAFGEDALDGAHKWNCPTCKHPQRTLRSSKIWALPPVLVICLKRFAMENGDFVKNNINVDFPVNDLIMTPYIHKKAILNMEPRYQLYAMTNHEGTLTSGHYTSIIHNHKTNRWLKFDDETVSEIDQGSIQNPKSYILFYKNVAM